MKLIKIRLPLPAVTPLLGILRAAAGELSGRLAVPAPDCAGDDELREAMAGPLLEAQHADMARLLRLFGPDFTKSGGVVVLHAGAGAGILRACAAVRLQVRAQFLSALPDAALESGKIIPAKLGAEARDALQCYSFLAGLQELIIQHFGDLFLEG
jgi:hypothetical protein